MVRLWKAGAGAAAVLAAMVGWLARAGADTVTWSAALSPAKVKPGAAAKVIVTADIEPGWHIYSLTQPGGGPVPTSVKLADGKGLTAAGAVKQPTPSRSRDANFGVDVETFETSARFEIPVRVAKNAAGKLEAQVDVRYMACDDHNCQPPVSSHVSVSYTVDGAAAPVKPGPAPSKMPPAKAPAAKAAATAPAAAAAGLVTAPAGTPPATPPAAGTPAAAPGTPAAGTPAGTPSTAPDASAPPIGSLATPSAAASSAAPQPQNAPLDDSERIRAAQKKGLLPFLGVAVTFGFLSLFVPCVFPMIPITVSFFVKRKEGALKAALAYMFGIISTFTILGIAVTVIFGASGISRFATNPWMNLVLGALFVGLALNLLGAFEIMVPPALLNKVQPGTAQGGLLGPMLMGLTFSITSFTCTVPFVGTVLVSAASGNVLYPLIGMLAFSTTFALPFFLLALMPGLLGKMPKSGVWLTSIKAFMGFVEIAAALKFLSNADLVWHTGFLTRPVFLALWAATAIIAACYLLGWLRLPHDDDTSGIGWGRRGIGVLTAAAAVMCLAGIEGKSLGKLNAFLPPAAYPGRAAQVAEKGEDTWLQEYDKAVAMAKEAGKPVFLDFTGVTCTNCRDMESNMFPRAEVKNELKHYVRAQLYTDRDTPADQANQALQRKLAGEITLPLYVAVDTNGRVLAKFGGSTDDANAFVNFLRSGRQGYGDTAN